MDFTHWTNTGLLIPGFDEPQEGAEQIVHTPMCPEPVHLIAIRIRPKPDKPYRYFLVYSTNLTLSVEALSRYY